MTCQQLPHPYRLATVSIHDDAVIFTAVFLELPVAAKDVWVPYYHRFKIIFLHV
jgi:hypothetical protein